MSLDSLQEKLQITSPPPKDDGDESNWVFGIRNTPNRVLKDAGFRHRNNTDIGSSEPSAPKYNQLPPGMEIDNQMRFTQGQMPLSTAGATDVTDNVKPEAMVKGYTRLEMKATDDQYTGEHVDHFYGEAVDENGLCGFVERNNYLDRE